MQNGYFQLVNAPGGYGLQIFQPKDGGADVNLQEVLNYLERESVPYDPMAIKKAILSGEDTVCFLERKDCPALEETYSIEEMCIRDRVVCAVMTGMGADGTEGIGKLRTSRKTYVIAQDQETSIVFGMPKSIIAAGLADQVVPLDQIAQEIILHVGVN